MSNNVPEVDNLPNIPFVVHDASGKILRYGDCPPDSVEMQASGAGETVLQKAMFKDAYVVNGELIPRPANPTVLSGMALTNVPAPSVVYIKGARYDVHESTVELEFTYPGKYRIVVMSWPYLDAKFEVMV